MREGTPWPRRAMSSGLAAVYQGCDQMSNQLIAPRRFIAGHARLLDRRRIELLFDGADAEPVLAAPSASVSVSEPELS
jgi:hypothetical protein